MKSYFRRLHSAVFTMNWIGGARNRVRHHGERKRQKEYFEKKKLICKSFNDYRSSPTKRKSGISQDLRAIHTINKAHAESFPFLQKTSRPVKKVDMGILKRPRIREVNDMGSSSPMTTPSKLMLMEPKYQRNAPVEEKKFYSSSASQVQMKIKNEQMILEDTPFMTEKKEGNQNLSSQEKYRQQKSREYNSISREVNLMNRKQFFVSEDFQATPLIKYRQHDRHSFSKSEEDRNKSSSQQDRQDLIPLKKEGKFQIGLDCIELPSTNVKKSNLFEDTPKSCIFKSPVNKYEMQHQRRSSHSSTHERQFSSHVWNTSNFPVKEFQRYQGTHDSFDRRSSIDDTLETPTKKCTPEKESIMMHTVIQSEDFIQTPVKKIPSKYREHIEKHLISPIDHCITTDRLVDRNYRGIGFQDSLNNMKWSYDVDTPKVRLHPESRKLFHEQDTCYSETDESVFTESSIIYTPTCDQKQLTDTDSFYGNTCGQIVTQNSDKVPDYTEDIDSDICKTDSTELYVPQALTPKSEMLYKKRTGAETPMLESCKTQLPKSIRLRTPEDYCMPFLYNPCRPDIKRGTEIGKESTEGFGTVQKNTSCSLSYSGCGGDVSIADGGRDNDSTHTNELQDNKTVQTIKSDTHSHDKWQDGIDELLAEINKLEAEGDEEFFHDMETEKEIQNEQITLMDETENEVTNVLLETVDKIVSGESLNGDQKCPSDVQFTGALNSSLCLTERSPNETTLNYDTNFTVSHSEQTFEEPKQISQNNNSERCAVDFIIKSKNTSLSQEKFESSTAIPDNTLGDLVTETNSTSTSTETLIQRVTSETQTHNTLLKDASVSPLLLNTSEVGIQCCLTEDNNLIKANLEPENSTSQESFYSMSSDTEQVDNIVNQKSTNNPVSYALRSKMK